MLSYSLVNSVRNSVQPLTEMLRHCPCSRRKCPPLGSLKFKRFDFIYNGIRISIASKVKCFKEGIKNPRKRSELENI